jgi:hypothetical protein
MIQVAIPTHNNIPLVNPNIIIIKPMKNIPLRFVASAQLVSGLSVFDFFSFEGPCGLV